MVRSLVHVLLLTAAAAAHAQTDESIRLHKPDGTILEWDGAAQAWKSFHAFGESVRNVLRPSLRYELGRSGTVREYGASGGKSRALLPGQGQQAVLDGSTLYVLTRNGSVWSIKESEAPTSIHSSTQYNRMITANNGIVWLLDRDGTVMYHRTDGKTLSGKTVIYPAAGRHDIPQGNTWFGIDLKDVRQIAAMRDNVAGRDSLFALTQHGTLLEYDYERGIRTIEHDPRLIEIAVESHPNDSNLYVLRANDPGYVTLQVRRYGEWTDLATFGESEGIRLAPRNATVGSPLNLRARPRVNSMGSSGVRAELAGAGRFAAAFLVKEAVFALETRNSARMREAAAQLATTRFWTSLAVFSIAARGTEHLVPARGFLRSALPLAAGMAAMQLMAGHLSLRDLTFSTASYLASGTLVELASEQFIRPLLFRGPAGWAFDIAKLAATLYLGEKLDAWLHTVFAQRMDGGQIHEQAGIIQKIDGLNHD